jgi:hypothetical protein
MGQYELSEHIRKKACLRLPVAIDENPDAGFG